MFLFGHKEKHTHIHTDIRFALWGWSYSSSGEDRQREEANPEKKIETCRTKRFFFLWQPTPGSGESGVTAACFVYIRVLRVCVYFF